MNPSRQIHNIALIGFMGCGKSSVGRLAAGRLGFALVDTDFLIESRAGQSISEMFASRGEVAFRTLEQEVVESLAERERVVIATGGGVGANPALLDSLKRHALVVWLWVSPRTIWQRVRHHMHRPLLQVADPEARIRNLLASRQPVYRQADVLINADSRRTADVAEQVVKAFMDVTRGAPAA